MMIVTHPSSVRYPPMRRWMRAVPANYCLVAASTELRLSAGRIRLQECDEGRVDLFGALLLNPVTRSLDDQLVL
jgi:hypothetical protein